MGQLFFIVIDAYSKWMEVYPSSSTSATATIEMLRRAFATHGLPDMLVSDNGTGFASKEFGNFMAKNGILHVKTAPRHPSSNGLVERSVRAFKDGMKKLEGSEGTVHTKLSRFLVAYRSTPQTTTGVTPAELLFNRRLRTRMDLIRPDVRQRVEAQQSSQKEQHNNTRTARQFAEGDKVLVKNFSPGPKWKKAHIESRTGPLSYTIKSEDGVVTCGHVDHILKRHDVPSRAEDNLPESAVHAEQNPVLPTAVEEQKDASTEPVSISMEESNGRSLARRSQRTRRTPSYLKDYVTV